MIQLNIKILECKGLFCQGKIGAVGETRTPTHFHAHEPESCVSTNSTTTALKLLEFYNMILIPFLNHPKNIRIKNSLFKPLPPIFVHPFVHTSESQVKQKVYLIYDFYQRINSSLPHFFQNTGLTCSRNHFVPNILVH